MQSKDSPCLQKWLSDNHYLSHGVVNEMITIMGNALLCDILKSIEAVTWFSVMADKLHISSMRTITDLLNNAPWAKDMFSEVDNLLCIYFTIAITTCTAERSVSCLRRVKNYLRSTMSRGGSRNFARGKVKQNIHVGTTPSFTAAGANAFVLETYLQVQNKLNCSGQDNKL